MNQTKILVMLDDEQDWLENYYSWLSPVLANHGVEVAAFTDDRDAAAYVCKRPRQIIGYLQDICRSETDWRQRHGLDFLDGIVRFITPHAPVVVCSGSVTREEVAYLARTGNVVWVLFKTSSDLRQDIATRIEELVLRSQTGVASPLRLPDTDVALLRDLSVPWKSVRRFLGAHPAILHRLPPREFERLIAELYRDLGWNVELTAPSRDGGYDLVALRQVGPQEVKVLVEVKRFSLERPVGVGLIRSLYATRVLGHASQVVIATSSQENHLSPASVHPLRRAVMEVTSS